MVRHTREHVRKFWMVQNRRTIGMLMVLFGVLYAIGFMFSSLMETNFADSISSVLVLWGVLFVLAIGAVVFSVAKKHGGTTAIMSGSEHRIHSRNIGIFLIAMVIGAILFALPVALVPMAASLMVLFSIGGILLLLYTFVNTVFGHSYYELGIASLIMWAAFVVTAFGFAGMLYSNPPAFQAISFMTTAITVVIVLALTGVVMMYRASEEFHREFRKVNRIR
ncbi:MAG: hypothetical protein ACREBF_00925 [Candidatus Micrarchaeales archaeon]